MAGPGKLDWDSIRIFLSAARKGSISAAARELGMDHSTVSRRISQLEYSIGASLFERRHAGLLLNRTGSEILVRAEAIEQQFLGIEATVSARGNKVTGTVRIAMMEGIASLYLSRRMRPLIAAHPALRLEIVTSPQHVQVSRREADVFLSFFPAAAKSVVSKKIGEFGLGLFASPDYLARNGEPRELSDLRAHVFVDYIRDLIQVDPVRWLDDVISEPRIAVTSSSMIAQMGCAAGGAGIVLLPYFAAAQETGLRRILDGKTDVRREIWLSVHSDLQGTSRMRAVERYITGILRVDRDYLLGKGPAAWRPGDLLQENEPVRA